MSNRYRVGSQIVMPDTPEFEPAIERAYASKERPQCMCQPIPIPMYIAKVAGKFILKRMPNSGETHSAYCDHYEPPPELSGLGQVLDRHVLAEIGEALLGKSRGGLDVSMPRAAAQLEPVEIRTPGITLGDPPHPEFGAFPVLHPLGASRCTSHRPPRPGLGGGVGIRPGLLPALLLHELIGDLHTDPGMVQAVVLDLVQVLVERLLPAGDVSPGLVGLGEFLVGGVVGVDRDGALPVGLGHVEMPLVHVALGEDLGKGERPR